MSKYRTLWNDLRDIMVAVQRLINVEHEMDSGTFHVGVRAASTAKRT